MRYFLVFSLCLLFACKKEQAAETPCGAAVVVSSASYNNTSTTNYNIIGASVSGNCLEVRFASSGCNGDTWVIEMTDSESLLKTNPPQRLLRLKLTNNELCAAVISKTVYFDLSPLKVPGNNTVFLNLAGYSGQLVYEY